MGLRSARWFAGDTEVALEHRAAIRAAGLPPGDADRPVIAILNSVSDLNPCNLPLRDVSRSVRDGVTAAGGLPVEVPTMSLGEDLMKPTAMLYRNLMAMEVEETIRAHPVDGVVLLGNCDKTIPAQLMGAASADIPAIQLSGGYRRPGLFRGKEAGAGTDLWTYWDARRAGTMDDGEWRDLERALGCGLGACNVMGTAMTMAILAEVLGMMPPGAAALPFDDTRLTEHATAAGRRIVELVRLDVRPGAILSAGAFRNALVALAAIGGSTNAIVHLCAIAGRRGIPLPLEEFDRASREVPVIADIAPVGRHNIAAFDAAGGVPALLAELRDHLDPDVRTVAGTRDGDTPVPRAATAIRPLESPVTDTPAIAVLTGSLAPSGAVVKAGAASPGLLDHSGPAVVFDGYQDMIDRIDDPELPVTERSVLVLRGCGPRGGDGFPEWGMIPIPKKLAARGVTDMVRVSDARMSGTSFGTCVLHVAPDAASGGPLALVEDGDTISLDVANRRLNLLVGERDLAARRASWCPRPSRHQRGWPRFFEQHVLQAPDGADFDFLRASAEGPAGLVEPVIGRS